MNAAGSAGQEVIVLGGGGPVGLGWQSGLLEGLLERGTPLSKADRVIGTSAGSVIGSSLALGMPFDPLVKAAQAPLPVPVEARFDINELVIALGDALQRQPSAEAARADVAARFATAKTVLEQEYIAASLFATFADRPWPSSLSVTAIATDTGALAAFDASSGVPLARALAASCAVPGIFPYVTIAGRPHMDGGLRTPLNADLAMDATAAMVVSCYALDLELTEGVDPVTAQQIADCRAVERSGARLEVVSPGSEFLELSGWGAHLMDVSRVETARELGYRQALEEAPRLHDLFS